MADASPRSSLLPFVVLAAAVAGFALFVALLLGGEGDADGLSLKGKDKVGLIEIVGPIMESRAYTDALDKLAEDKDVKAIVLRIDSPGGAVGPSQEIYNAVLKLRAQKPVVVSMGSVAASGGFYIASAGSQILANAGTLTGSIGVIMAFADLSELLEWAKVKMEVVKTGDLKDTGSGYRHMNEEERAYLQTLIDEVLAQFVSDVATGRQGHMTSEQVKAVADGRVFTGAKAKELGFIDTIGGYPEAVSLAGQMGGITGKPEVFEPRLGPPWYERMLEEGMAAPIKHVSQRLVPLWAMWLP